MKKYDKEGRLLMPIAERKSMVKEQENKVRYIIDHAYCPKGCSIIDAKNKIHGFPGIRIRFRRENMEGEFVISAIEDDFEKIVLSGSLKYGLKDELFCPHCNAQLEKLVNCNCSPEADLIVIGLTPELNFNDAITFCNVTGCHNGTFIKSGDVIRRLRLHGSI